MNRFMLLPLALLALVGCGSPSNTTASGNTAAATSVDAVTAEAISDTQAATADATAAADAELDRLSNSIDEAAPDNRAVDAGSGKAKVVIE